MRAVLCGFCDSGRRQTALSYLPDYQCVLKAALNAPVADEQPLDGPEGLTGCHEP
jgi:hypothetical protein